ncbi:MAG: L-threonylcarbamoyladenylate synthase [Candidatus Uhrbacteria bacterium]
MITFQSALASAVIHLRRGGLLIYPTETSYAIGCDVTNARSVAAIFRLKGREHGKSLPIIVASRAMAERYAKFTSVAQRLARRHWPGPLTLVMEQKISPPPTGKGSERGWGMLAPGVVARDGTVALRVSSHPIVRALSRRLGRPIVATSANRSGEPPAFSARAALRALMPVANVRRIPLLAIDPAPLFVQKWCGVDGGVLPRRKPSTIVDARGVEPIIIRLGAVRL